MHKKNRMALAVALACAACAARADQSLAPITVTATRTSTEADKVAAAVTVIDRRQIERRQPTDEADLFKDEPDIAYARDLRRFGATRVNIRGVEDNRVAQLVDGVRLPDFYNSGGPTNFTMNAALGASLDFLKRVEILRGPASSLYGSDAMGGVVGYLTLDPDDLLNKDKPWAARYRFAHSGVNNGRTHSLLGAWRSAGVSALLGYSRTDAHAADNMAAPAADVAAAARTAPNPQDIADQGVLAKFSFRPAAGHRFGLTIEGREQDTEVDARRLSASLPKVTAMLGSDQARRVRAGIEWEHMPQAMFYDRLSTRLHQQEADTRNANLQTRSNTSATCSAAAGAGNDCLIEQEFLFSQRATGLSAQFESGFTAGRAEHLLTYGVDAARVTTEEKRDAVVRNTSTGATSKSLAGDTFPLRDFAPGRTATLGLFVQDEIALGALSLTPGLRYDRRSLSPEVDQLAGQVLAGINRSAVDKTESAFSPKLAALWRVAPSASLYGQLVRGFRAPNYEEVNGAFRNLVQRYGSSPNPDLHPETSVGVEAGLKLHAQGVRGQLSFYDNRYRDFIENVRLDCPSDARCIAGLASTFMYVNRAHARIRGVDARAAWNLASDWKLDGALAYAHGENESTGRALNGVEPLRASIGLAHDAGHWGVEGRLRLSRAVTRSDDSAGAWFRPSGYGVSDVTAWWRVAEGVRLQAAINNLFDKKYWLWSDIRQADAPNPAGVDFYSQPGRNMSLSVRFDL